MDEESVKRLKEITERPSEIKPKGLVRRFKSGLKEAGVEIEEATGAKYFAAGMSGVEILVLAHESTKDGWWGITEDIVERVKASDALREKGVTWGAALLDKSHSRGYWVLGENISKLKTLGLVTLGKVQYHFKHDDLQRKPDLAPYFWTIDEFLTHSRLRKTS